MKTEKLFEKDSYLKETVSELLAIKENIAFFTKTIFYANSGGQPGDIGYIVLESGEKINVLDTKYDENRNICHYLEKPIQNSKEKCKLVIDWQHRFSLMRMHTCMHVICSLITSHITGCAVGCEKSRMDFSLIDNQFDREDFEKKLNLLIEKGAEVTYEIWDKEKLEKNLELVRTAKVFPPSFENKYRLVRIAGVDLQPCGGTHVANIKEIGKIRISKVKSKGGNNKRIYLEFA